MPNHSSIHIVGHLGKDPEQSQAGEHSVTRFSVAVTRKRKSGDVTTWWNVTAWRQDAEYAARYLKKGDAVMVVGEPYMEEYEKDGQKRTSLKVEASRVVSLSNRQRDDAAPRDMHEAVAAVKERSKQDLAADEPPF